MWSAHLARCCCRRSEKRVPRWRAPVCRLSVWRWRHRGLSRKLGSEVDGVLFFSKERQAWDPSARCAHPSSRSDKKKGKRETGRPCECGGQVRVTHVRVFKHREGLLGPLPYSCRGQRAQQSLTATDATGIVAEESEANAAEQLARSQNIVIKVFRSCTTAERSAGNVASGSYLFIYSCIYCMKRSPRE